MCFPPFPGWKSCQIASLMSPIGGWYFLFSMGRVKSGWLGNSGVFLYCSRWFLNGLDITGCHLLDAQQLECSVDELSPEHLQRSLVPVPLGCYNVHNVLAGSNIFYLGLFCQASGFPKPKTQVIGWGRLYCCAMSNLPDIELGQCLHA